jgi:hypothetical protein
VTLPRDPSAEPARPAEAPPPAEARARVVLLTSTSWWPLAARIAMRFAALGWRVEASCPPGHPLRHCGAVTRLHPYPALRPLPALRGLLATARPDLVLPCDDRCAQDLYALHAQLDAADSDPARAGARLIARSLGRPDAYPILAQRSALIAVARAEGLHAPLTRAVDGAGALRAALADIGLPAVLKVDGTWGGLGTVVVTTAAQAERRRAALSRPLGAARAFKRLLIDRDPYYLQPWLDGTVPRVNVQRFIAGRPANSLAACWDGEVLARSDVEVLRANGALGASTVVRAIEHPDMARTAERLARRLGLSGFIGFDFMIEDGTGHAHLIEVNPRSTPLCHLALGPGRDPIGALVARLAEMPAPGPAPDCPSATGNPIIAFFPQAWLADPGSALLRIGHHDVPWDDPALVRELLRLSYPHRGVLARLLAGLRGGRGAGTPESLQLPFVKDIAEANAAAYRAEGSR